jgi:hypothetical protein
LGEWVVPRRRTAGGGGSHCTYRNAGFFNGIGILVVSRKIVRAQKRTNDPFKNETQEDFKRLKKYFGTNHSNYETREREK